MGPPPQRARRINPNVVDLTPSLSVADSDDRVDIFVLDRLAARIEHRSGRPKVSMALLGGRRCIDVSTQPGTVPTLLRREARTRREDPNRWCSGVARVVFDRAPAWAVDDLTEGDRDDLDALLASLPFPLVRLTRREGAGPMPHVPRWAEAALRADSARQAVRSLFGERGTRGMARALPLGLMPGRRAPAEAAPDLRPLGLAVSLAPHLEAGRLATLLAGTDHWLPPQHWPSDHDLRELRRLWRVADPATATALALDAVGVDDGIARLRWALAVLEPLASVSDLTLARTVGELERQAVRTAPPAPAPAPAPPRPRDRDPLPAAPLRAPRAGPGDRPAPEGHPFGYPPTVAVAHGYRIGEHRLVLPRTPSELTRWARRLSNCLADYATAVGDGASVVLGLEERGVLVAALELRAGRVRQFVGIANARPTPRQREVVTQMLRDLALTIG